MRVTRLTVMSHVFLTCWRRSMEEGGRRRMGLGRSQLGRRERGRREGEEREGEEREGEEDIFVLGGDKAYRGMRRPLGWRNWVTKSAKREERKERGE